MSSGRVLFSLEIVDFTRSSQRDGSEASEAETSSGGVCLKWMNSSNVIEDGTFVMIWFNI